MAAGLRSDAVSLASVRLRATRDVDVEDLPALSALRRRQLAGEGLRVSISKTPNGRFRARPEERLGHVAIKVFDTKREATAWLARERDSLDRRGRSTSREGAGQRRGAALARHPVNDRRTDDLPRRPGRRAADHGQRPQPPPLGRLGRGGRARLEHLLASGLVESSVVRYRASLSSFLGWWVRRS